jgi:hypothetical protein
VSVPHWSATVLAISLVGCAAELEDPARFLNGGHTSELSCEVDVEDILAVHCGSSVCHSAEAVAADPDLVTPGIAERVRGMSSTSPGCGGRVLAVPGDPDGSLLYQKVASDPPCGSRMPLAQDPLSDADIACIGAWIQKMQ